MFINVTGPETTGLIYAKYICLYYGAYPLFCIPYIKSVSSIEFLMVYCIASYMVKGLLQYWVKTKSYYILKCQN